MSLDARDIVGPYVEVAGAAAQGKAPYPGSPAIALTLTRATDRLTFCELHPAAVAALKASVGRDRRTKILAIDGYTGLKASVPPVERRGFVLIDPPFEAEAEFDALANAFVTAHRKWRGGILLAWHPIKNRRGVEHLAATFAEAIDGDILRLEFHVAPPTADGPLTACGLFVVNPPYTLESEMRCLLPELAKQLSEGRGSVRIALLPSRAA